MFNKIKEWSGVIAVVLLLIGVFIPSQTSKLGNATASYQDAAQGFYVNGVQIAASDASLITGLQQANGHGLFVGSSSTNYDITQIVFATSTFATTTFGAVTSATGTLFSQMTFPFPNLGTDDVCMASLTSAPTSTAFALEAFISSATATTATSSLLFENGTSTAQTIGAGMVTVMCFDPSF